MNKIKIKKLPSWYLTLTFFFGIVGLTTLILGEVGQAQDQNPQSNTPSEQMRPTTKIPLGHKRGLEELKAVLDASEPTNAPSIRRVVILIPENLPKHIRLTEAGATAIREFYLIAERNYLNFGNPSSHTSPYLESPEGPRAMLPNGGTIRLRIRKIEENENSCSIGELHIEDHRISGYEQVNQIEFVTQ